MSRIEDYLTFLEGHGRTPKTIKDYRLKLNEASAVLAQGGLSSDPADTDEEAYLYLRRALHGSEDTVRQIMKAWDRFVGWCTGRRVLANTGLLWNRHQVRRTFISPADYARMLRHADIATTVECYIEPSRAREMDALDRVCSALLG